MQNCQQFELYAAQIGVLAGRRFNDVGEMQVYVDDLRERTWWDLYYPGLLRIEVYGRPARMHESVGTYHEHNQAGVIEMLPVHWSELHVLHEVCHVLAACRYGSRSHDPWFARTFLETVSRVMGADTYVALLDGFEAQGIDHDVEGTGAGIAL